MPAHRRRAPARRSACPPPRSPSSSPGVHLQMRVAPQLGDLHEGRAITKMESVLRSTVGPLTPPSDDQLRELFAGGATPQRPAQIDPTRGVETEVPQAVGGEAAAIAVRAERRRGRGDDAEDG